ncbi:hypothetical protein ABPG75_009271 [Micractinium tetrahymenae]
MPSDYTTLMLQYRHGKDTCVPRYFGDGNQTVFSTEWVYMLETGFLEMLMQSGHRTLDPEEAGELVAAGGRGGRAHGAVRVGGRNGRSLAALPCCAAGHSALPCR